MADGAVSQYNQSNWHIGVVDGSESPDFEVVDGSGDADFLAFLISKNCIINTRVVIQPDHPAAVACIGCFKEQIVVRGRFGHSRHHIAGTSALCNFKNSGIGDRDPFASPLFLCRHCVFFIVFADSTKARYRRYRAKALSGGGAPSALPTEDNEELIAPLTVFTPSLSCWHPVSAAADSSRGITIRNFISIPNVWKLYVKDSPTHRLVSLGCKKALIN